MELCKTCDNLTISPVMSLSFPLQISSSLARNLIKLFHGFLKLTNGSINFAENTVGKDFIKIEDSQNFEVL